MADKVGGILDRMGTPADTNISTDIANIKSVIDALANLTDKEKAFMGIAGQPTLNDHFLTVGAGVAPDTAIWTVTKDNDASVEIFANFRTLKVEAGSGATDDGYCTTIGKKGWRTPTYDTAGSIVLHFKTRISIADLTGEAAFGLIVYSATPTADVWDAETTKVVGIHCDNDTVQAITSMAAATKTDISAHISDNTRVEIEMVYTVGVDVKFYMDGTLRATHAVAANLPTQHPLDAVFASKNTNGVQTVMYVDWAEVWAE